VGWASGRQGTGKLLNCFSAESLKPTKCSVDVPGKKKERKSREGITQLAVERTTVRLLKLNLLRAGV
jgi:hypothetical protein